MEANKWKDAKKEKPINGVSVLVCISGKAGNIRYERAYSIGEYWGDDDEWEVQEFGCVPPKGIEILAWKYIEGFGREEHPVKTILQDFLEKCPNAPMVEDMKIPRVCVELVGYKAYDRCLDPAGGGCKACWNRPLEVE